MPTFNVYLDTGEALTVELDRFTFSGQKEIVGTTSRFYAGEGVNKNVETFFIAVEKILALHRPNKPHLDPLLDEQPRCFKVYLKHHAATPLQIYAHYFERTDANIEFYYERLEKAIHSSPLKREQVPDLYIRPSAVVAIISSDPLPPPQ